MGQVFDEGLKFEGLDFAEALLAFGIAPLAKVDEVEWVPAFGEFGLFDLAGEFGEAGVISDAAKPIFGVRVIGFAPMDDCMDVTSVWRLDVLHDFVGGIEMVVPYQDCGAKELGSVDDFELIV